MREDIDILIANLDAITAEVRGKFGGLSVEQLNTRPPLDGWSVAQCLDHLITTSEVYSKDFKAIASGQRHSGYWERWSPLSGMFGRLLISSLGSDDRKVKTKPRFVPPSEVEGDIVEKFAASQEELKATIAATVNADWQNTIVTSSFMSFVTYSLDDAYKIIIAHQHRHVRQAERLMQMRGFPQ